MSQSPVPPRYPPQQPTQPIPAYPQTNQEGYLVALPGQAQSTQAVQPLPYASPTGQYSGGVWNQNGILVMHKQAQLPPQCIKCGAPGDGQPLKRKITWHPGWVFLILLASPIIYIIVAMVIQERATVYVSLCQEHRRKRRLNMMIAWGVFLASIACFVMAGNVRGNDPQLYWSMASIVGFLIAVLYALINSRMLTPQKIDPQYVWLKGISPQYVNQFPPMPS